MHHVGEVVEAFDVSDSFFYGFAVVGDPFNHYVSVPVVAAGASVAGAVAVAVAVAATVTLAQVAVAFGQATLQVVLGFCWLSPRFRRVGHLQRISMHLECKRRFKRCRRFAVEVDA